MSDELEKIKEDIADLNENRVQRGEQLKQINEKLDRLFEKLEKTNTRLQALENCFSTSKTTIKTVAYIAAAGVVVIGVLESITGIFTAFLCR